MMSDKILNEMNLKFWYDAQMKFHYITFLKFVINFENWDLATLVQNLKSVSENAKHQNSKSASDSQVT